MIDIARRHRMIEAFKATHGEEVAMTLAEGIYSTDHATKTDLEPLATKADLEALDIRIDNCATKTDLKALETRIDNCATKADLERCATKVDLERFATKADLEPLATKSDLATLEERLGRQLNETINKHLWRFLGLIVALIATAVAQQIFG